MKKILAAKSLILLSVLLPAMSAISADVVCGAPRKQSCAEIIWKRTLCKEPGRYIGWPSVTRCADARLLAVFSGDRDKHVCPYGKVQMVESRDNGETWSAPRTLRNSPLDDRDAGILELKNGDLLLTWFTSLAFTTLGGNPYGRHAEKIQESDMIRHLGHFTMRSVDGGKTWGEPVPTCSSAPHGGIQLKDGRLMMIGREWSCHAGMVAADPRNGKMQDRVLAEVSEDGGRSWKVIKTLTPPSGQTAASLSLCEPTLAELPDGTIIAQFRADKAGQTVYQSESSDGGANWTILHPTPLCGLPPHLLALRDGRLLSTYTRRRAWDTAKNETSELKACISKDGGATWNTAEEVVLATSASADMGYSSTVELDNGNLLTVYYMHEKPNEGCCLMGTLWRPSQR